MKTGCVSWLSWISLPLVEPVGKIALQLTKPETHNGQTQHHIIKVDTVAVAFFPCHNCTLHAVTAIFWQYFLIVGTTWSHFVVKCKGHRLVWSFLKKNF